LSNRFAGVGQDGSAADLTLYIKVSDTVISLLQTLGLDKTLQQPVAGSGDGGAHARLTAILTNLIRARQEEEAQGVFRDDEGNIIADPARLAIEQQIYALKQKRDVAPVAAPNVVPIRPERHILADK
jgi:hypothetical protein